MQNLTALENVELASQICKDPLPARRRAAPRWGLGHRLDNFPAQLSGGEQQSVAIARALAKNPKLLLADEPTGALDYQTGKAILKLLQDTCHSTGKTVVLITHNAAFTDIADRVIHIREGRVAGVECNDRPLSAGRAGVVGDDDGERERGGGHEKRVQQGPRAFGRPFARAASWPLPASWRWGRGSMPACA